MSEVFCQKYKMPGFGSIKLKRNIFSFYSTILTIYRNHITKSVVDEFPALTFNFTAFRSELVAKMRRIPNPVKQSLIILRIRII